MFTPSLIVLIITVVTTGLIAGLFYSWSCSVTLGLARVSDNTYVEAFQQMNRAILNPAFFVIFLGTAILLPVSVWLNYTPGTNTRFWWLVGASAFYLMGVFGVTMVGNVPMNDALDKFQLASATAQEISAQRAVFEVRWNNLNLVRAACATIALIMLVIACVTNIEK